MTETITPLQVMKLSKVFNGRTVLRNVCLTVERSECIVLTGANGSGKTTLLRCLSGALRPNAGAVLWDQRPARADPASLRQIGFVAHESRLYAHLTLRENLIFAARMSGVANPRKRADELLDKIGLEEFSKSLPTLLSRGMRQRLAIARALVHDPHIVLLDEPSSGLDEEGFNWLVDLIRRLCDRGGCCCVATHDTGLCRGLGSRNYRLRSGQLEEHLVSEAFVEQIHRPSAA